MANTAAAIVDRVLPDVPVRQYVLTLPYELRRLAAFKADVLTALGRIFVEAIFASCRGGAQRNGVDDAQCGSITFVHRAGSLNLNVHFHVTVLDGVFTRDAGAGVLFHPAAAPTREDLDAIVLRVRDRSLAWLRRRGYLDARSLEERSNEPTAQTALDACAAIAIGRGQVATLPNADTANDDDDDDHGQAPDKPALALAVDKDGFNLHAGVRVEAGDDLGRERLARYGCRPPLSLERLRRLPGGRVAYRLKHVSRGRGKHRVMSAMEFMARLSAIIAPPRYPLVRYAGVLGPRSAWRKDIVPKPRERPPACDGVAGGPSDDKTAKPRAQPKKGDTFTQRPELPREAAGPTRPADGSAAVVMQLAPDVPSMTARPDDVIALAPNVLSVRHWDRLIGGALYAATPRLDWARLLRRSFEVDVMQCPKCQGRLRVLAVITEREPVQRILAHLGVFTEVPPLARARDPADDLDDAEPQRQLTLGLA